MWSEESAEDKDSSEPAYINEGQRGYISSDKDEQE